MNQADFDKVFSDAFDLCQSTLNNKGVEYSRDSDRLHNFKVAAALQSTTPEKALIGMWAKHIVSILDIAENPDLVDDCQFYEKVTDSINYLILLSALIRERRGWL